MAKPPFLVSEKLLRRYISKPIILDTKPLVLFLAGIYNPDKIGDRLTAGFEREDFELLCKFLSNFKGIIITPHILTEASNIINRDLPKSLFCEFFEKVLSKLEEFHECSVNKNDIFLRDETKRLGITDVGIILSCELENSLILTKDFKFSLEFSQKGYPIVHFDFLRSINWKKSNLSTQSQ
ncbi:hypothetical protein HN903_03520 [archaeon]|jgi:hypothetical protein|nr:hypothetical protein [archaeon]MBT7128799.1 hypothetical protein [archaeon]